jgi:hypothetical protein
MLEVPIINNYYLNRNSLDELFDSKRSEIAYKKMSMEDVYVFLQQLNSLLSLHEYIEDKAYFEAGRRNLLKRKIMVSLLKEMDKNTNICLNNINSINFIYQIYGKGINIIQHEKNELNKTQSIMNCMRKHKFYTQINTNKNYKTSKLSFVSAENNKFHTFYSTDKLILSNKSKHKPNLINKSRKKPLKRSHSCCINNSKKNHKENFVLLPLKNILLKKTIENFNHIPVMPVVKHKTRTSIIYKKREIIEEEKEREYKNNLKLFSIKYEKEKEDFSNILFDECVELRKKKFKLDSFIKRFTNKHFVEKLYRIKEIALQKNQ